jgi:hypothetical protein
VLAAVLCSERLLFARFAMPAMPVLAVLAALGASPLAARLAGAIRRPGSSAPLLSALALIALTPNALTAVKLDQLAAAPDTRVQAVEWIQSNLPAGAKIVAQASAVPDGDSGIGDGLRDYGIHRIHGLPAIPQFSHYLCDGYRYLLLSSEDIAVDPAATPSTAGPTLYERIEQRLPLLAGWSPGVGQTSVPFDVDDRGVPFWQIEDRERTGPTIRLYRLPEQPSSGCRDRP